MAARYLANMNTKEIHDLAQTVPDCRIDEILPHHKKPVDSLSEVHVMCATQGYNGCAYCLRRLHTD